jgi:hypothetical protein
MHLCGGLVGGPCHGVGESHSILKQDRKLEGALGWHLGGMSFSLDLEALSVCGLGVAP